MRDVSEAYVWAQSLPQSTREELKSVELMVAAYLKAKRSGSVSLPSEGDQSQSAQDFQKALKGLQTELDQFDFAPPGQTEENTSLKPVAPPVKPTSKPIPLRSSQPQNPQPTGSENQNLKLDSRSMKTIQEIRTALNLSSDTEVIRMCLTLAQRALKNLY